MKHIKHHLMLTIAAALLIAAGPSYATTYKTCPDGSKVEVSKPCPEPPKPEPPVTTPINVTWTGDQRQEQTQTSTQTIKDSGNSTATGGSSTIKDSGNGTGIGVGVGGAGGNSTATGGAGGHGGSVSDVGNNSGNSTNLLGQSTSTNIGDVGSTSAATGGNVGDTSSASVSGSYSGGNSLGVGDTSSASTSGASADGSGNSDTSVTIDSSDRSSSSYSDNSSFLALPLISNAAPAIVASPALTVVPGVCGPRVVRHSERAQATYVGLIFKSEIDLGNDDLEVILAEEPFKYHTDRAGNVVIEGSKVDYVAYAVGAAASRSIGANGGQTGGGYGGLGVSSGSSIQRPMIRALITPCLMPVMQQSAPPIVVHPKVALADIPFSNQIPNK